MASTVRVNALLFENDFGRLKQVKVGDDELPDHQEPKRGVQQGSVLSPMFSFCFVFSFIYFYYYYYIFFYFL